MICCSKLLSSISMNCSRNTSEGCYSGTQMPMAIFSLRTATTKVKSLYLTIGMTLPRSQTSCLAGAQVAIASWPK